MEKYDFIIVGAGSAGCVLAHRLSSDPTIRVLLLEAGDKDHHLFQKIPGGYSRLFRTKADWGFYSEPQEHLHGRQLYLPRGKVMGGCSTTNAMAYVRGNAEDYDLWEKNGCNGWSYNDVLPYFIKSEHSECASELDESFHGVSGPLHVSLAKSFETPFLRAFLSACENQGIPRNKDYNGHTQKGAGKFQFTIKNNRRHGGADAFIHPVSYRRNLHILTKARVHNIEIQNDKATSVWVSFNGKSPERIDCSKEILLCAGSFHSPQILMLSGIGDPRELSRHNIQIKIPLPGVGRNLQDHLFFPVSVSSKIQGGLNHHLKPLGQIKAIIQYLLQRKGPLTIGPLEGVAFFDSMNDGHVDCQFHFSPFHIGKSYDYDIYDLSCYPHFDGYTILPSLISPKSRGHICLRSANPLDPPSIQPHFLSRDQDLETLIRGGKKAMEIMEDPAFDPYRKEWMLPNHRLDEGEWADHIKKTVETIYHPSGTCKMGMDSDAVTNPQLKVHGVNGLRVVDCSIMPTIVRGNTNAPVYMIAEKAASMILAEYGSM
ncbi:MAG TPA: GMC family oxidoreductase N-terminal domain-containing protein [Saprospiraceae bacterium]|nr:GMC family oxidoreductase N-terminal domain-containing protein [Saprospiraceae bacterium]